MKALPKNCSKLGEQFFVQQNDTSEEVDNFQDAHQNRQSNKKASTTMSHINIEKLICRLKNKANIHNFREVDGKIECPFCGIFIKNVQIHFQRKPECGVKIDMDHFKTVHEEYRKENNRIRDRMKKTKQKIAITQVQNTFSLQMNTEECFLCITKTIF